MQHEFDPRLLSTALRAAFERWERSILSDQTTEAHVVRTWTPTKRLAWWATWHCDDRRLDPIREVAREWFRDRPEAKGPEGMFKQDGEAESRFGKVRVTKSA